MNDLQKKQLDILKEFIRVCKKHNLHYFLVGVGITLPSHSSKMKS